MRRGTIEQVIVCGMGGSGISGEILQALYPQCQIMSNKAYSVPAYADNRSLALVISYSGNTEETLSNYAHLRRQNARIVTITSNGKMMRKKSDLTIRVPGGLPPRGALGYLFAPLPCVLYAYHLIAADPRQSLLACASFLIRQRKKIEAQAQKIAAKVVDHLPLIYANSDTFMPVAKRWQCQLNENAKMLAHVNVFPEMNHNEIVGLGRPRQLNKRIVAVFLNDPQAHKRNQARVAIVKQIISDTFADVIDVQPLGRSRLERIFWTIWLGDFVSYYCAVRSNIDPLPVARIDYLKKRLAQLK
jgi:glucose/mannose-6-phosphate isomerase